MIGVGDRLTRLVRALFEMFDTILSLCLSKGKVQTVNKGYLLVSLTCVKQVWSEVASCA